MKRLLYFFFLAGLAMAFFQFGEKTTIRTSGNEESCKELMGDVRVMLYQLRTQIALGSMGDLPIYRLERKYPDGSYIRALSVHGREQVEVWRPGGGRKKGESKVQDYAIALFTYYLNDAVWQDYKMFSGVYRSGKWQKLGAEGQAVLVDFHLHDYGSNLVAAGFSNNDARMALHPCGLIATVTPGYDSSSNGVALVQVSKDFGKTWGTVDSFTSTNTYEAYVSIEVSKSGIICLLVSTTYCSDGDDRYQIYKSTDKGESFQLVNTIKQLDDEWTENPSLGVTDNSWLFGGTTNQMFVNNSGSVTYYGDIDTESPYATGSFVANPSVTDVYGQANAVPQMGLSDSGTLCWVDSTEHTLIQYATPYQVGGTGNWFVQNPFTGEISEEVSANTWTPAGNNPLVGMMRNWSDRPAFSNNPVEFIKQDEHACILRNGVKVWDGPFNTVFAYWGTPSEIRADGKTWVASFMNMNSNGEFANSAGGDTWGILVSVDDGQTWTVKAVTGSTIINNTGASTLGGKASIDIAGKKIVVAITQIDKLQVFLSENKGESFTNILDETSPSGYSFSNFLMSPVRIVDLNEQTIRE